jgi:hypothetical protein
VCLLFDIFLPSPFHEIILTSVRKEGSRSCTGAIVSGQSLRLLAVLLGDRRGRVEKLAGPEPKIYGADGNKKLSFDAYFKEEALSAKSNIVVSRSSISVLFKSSIIKLGFLLVLRGLIEDKAVPKLLMNSTGASFLAKWKGNSSLSLRPLPS